VPYLHWVSPQLRFECSTNKYDEIIVLLRVKGIEGSCLHGDIGRGGQWLGWIEGWRRGLELKVDKLLRLPSDTVRGRLELQLSNSHGCPVL
jgi:hypothetical protein